MTAKLVAAQKSHVIMHIEIDSDAKLDDEEINIMQKIEVEFSDIYEIVNNGGIPSYSREFPPPRISGVF